MMPAPQHLPRGPGPQPIHLYPCGGWVGGLDMSWVSAHCQQLVAHEAHSWSVCQRPPSQSKACWTLCQACTLCLQVEDYYFSAAAGRARIVVGNRRWGESGYVASGRMQARPVGPPGKKKASCCRLCSHAACAAGLQTL